MITKMQAGRREISMAQCQSLRKPATALIGRGRGTRLPVYGGLPGGKHCREAVSSHLPGSCQLAPARNLVKRELPTESMQASLLGPGPGDKGAG